MLLSCCSFLLLRRSLQQQTNRKESRGKRKREQTPDAPHCRSQERMIIDLTLARFRWCVVAVAVAVEKWRLEERERDREAGSIHSSSATHSSGINRSEHSALASASFHHPAEREGSVTAAIVVPSASLPSLRLCRRLHSHHSLHHCNRTPFSSHRSIIAVTQ